MLCDRHLIRTTWISRWRHASILDSDARLPSKCSLVMLSSVFQRASFKSTHERRPYQLGVGCSFRDIENLDVDA